MKKFKIGDLVVFKPCDLNKKKPVVYKINQIEHLNVEVICIDIDKSSYKNHTFWVPSKGNIRQTLKKASKKEIGNYITRKFLP